MAPSDQANACTAMKAVLHAADVWQQLLDHPSWSQPALCMAVVPMYTDLERHRQQSTTTQCPEVQHRFPCHHSVSSQLPGHRGKLGAVLEAIVAVGSIPELSVFLLLGH